MDNHNKNWLKAMLLQLLMYVLIILGMCATSYLCTSCDSDNGSDTYRMNITGSYIIKETNGNNVGEKIIFDSNGVWYYDKSVVYPDDDVYGNYIVDEKNTNTIYCFYYIESEDEEYVDTMKVRIDTPTIYTATGVPTHGNKTLLLEKQ